MHDSASHNPWRLRGALLGWGLLLLGVGVPVSGMAGTGKAMQLELGRLDGAAFVRLSDHVGEVVVLNFWRSDCPPCVQEMPMLSALTVARPELAVIGIAMGEPSLARRFMELHPTAYVQLRAPAQPGGLLRRFGNASGALPYTVVLDAQHGLCESKVGAVEAAWLQTVTEGCQAISSGGPRYRSLPPWPIGQAPNPRATR